MKTLRSVGFTLLLAAASTRAQDTRVLPMPAPPQPTMADEIAGIRADAMKAYAAGAWEVYLKGLQEMSQRLPNHPDLTMRLAAAQARAGRSDEALETLAAVANMGVSVDFDADKRNAEDFASVSSRPEFREWRQRIKANTEPKLVSKVWHTFADADLLAEDVAYDSKARVFYVSSLLKHALLRVDADGHETAFALEAPEKDWNLLGVAVDSRRGVLWVSAQAIRGFPGIKEEDAGKGRLSAYGLKSGKRLYSHGFKPAGVKQAAIGDIAVGPGSELLASDSEQALLYRVGPDRKDMDVLERPFFSPQDIAFTEDGKTAFVADYVRGIARIDLATGEQLWLSAPRNIALSGIDGLYLRGKGLLAVQNGVHPPRIAQFALDEAQRSVTRCEVLERGDALADPTHGVIVGNEFVYIANSGWRDVDEHGAPKAGAKLTPPVLRKLKLK